MSAWRWATGLYARKNKDGTVSITLRKRIEGKAHSTDLPVIVLETVTSAALSNARAKAEKRAQGRWQGRATQGRRASDGQAPGDASACDVAASLGRLLLATVDEGGKWSEHQPRGQRTAPREPALRVLGPLDAARR